MPAPLAETRDLVRRLARTDLCLFTDARYTRHPSQADPSTPFQDHPVSLEHFPSGSFGVACMLRVVQEEGLGTLCGAASTSTGSSPCSAA